MPHPRSNPLRARDRLLGRHLTVTALTLFTCVPHTLGAEGSHEYSRGFGIYSGYFLPSSDAMHNKGVFRATLQSEVGGGFVFGWGATSLSILDFSLAYHAPLGKVHPYLSVYVTPLFALWNLGIDAGIHLSLTDQWSFQAGAGYGWLDDRLCFGLWSTCAKKTTYLVPGIALTFHFDPPPPSKVKQLKWWQWFHMILTGGVPLGPKEQE